MPPARVGLAIAAWLTAAGIANYAGPWLSDRIGRRRPVLVGGAAVAGLALAAMAIAPASATVPLLVVAALGGGCVAPLLFALPAEIEGVGPARVGAALGLLVLVGQMGGFLLPSLTGRPRRGSAGLPGAIGGLAVVHLLILAPALGMRDTRDRSPRALRRPRRLTDPCCIARSALVLARSRRPRRRRMLEQRIPECHVGADCASGACDSSGQCVPVTRAAATRAGAAIEATASKPRSRPASRRAPGDDA